MQIDQDSLEECVQYSDLCIIMYIFLCSYSLWGSASTKAFWASLYSSSPSYVVCCFYNWGNIEKYELP